MPRGQKIIKKREIQPDLRYGDVKVAKFINYVMRKGKKSKAQNIVYKAFEIIKEKTHQDPIKIFDQAVKNAGPFLEVRPKRIGGATYQIPYEVSPYRRFTLGAKWIIEAAKSKKGKPMFYKLTEEILAAYNNEGTAVKKKLDTHKMAEANKAFAHYARF